MITIEITGKNALVCGSTQGIGYATAKLLAECGANCVLVARNEDKLKTAISTLTSKHNQTHNYLIADFSNPDQIEKVVSDYLLNNNIDILINNTGGPASGAILNATPTEFLSAFNQHLISNHILVKHVVEGMKKNKYGRIINVVSTSVKIPLHNLGVSNTIRGAVASWSKTMANELGKYNITVNNVLPGATMTERLSTIITKNSEGLGKPKEEIEQKMLHEIPMGRFAQPDEIANLICFLASPLASYINGTSIPVDGGRTGSI